MSEPVRLLITGYDCALVDPPNIMEWECPICLLVLREPCLVSCCGRNFCQACIAVVQDKGEKCPICRVIAFTSMHNKGLERILQSLLVKCESERLGCAWSGELRTLDRHLEAVCLYADVRCKHGCPTIAKRMDIAEHENKCGRRPLSCCYCQSYNSTYDDVVSAHHLVCPSVRVPCPNGCNAVLERQHLKQHIDNVCPNSVVECDFSCCGCRVKTTRRELPAHLNTDLPFHMSMLSKSHAQLLLEVQQLKSKNNAMMSYLKTSLTLAQDVRISVEIGYQKPLVPGKLLQKNFYSDIGGYKMQLQILCSTSDHLSKYVRLYPRVYLMKGEFDEFLSWPFEGEVTMSTPLSCDKMHIYFSVAPQKCKTRVLNDKGIAEEGVGSAADIIVDVERFREGNRDYRALFKVENVKECTNNWMLKQLRQRRTLVYT
eukprot:Em0001g2505a